MPAKKKTTTKKKNNQKEQRAQEKAKQKARLKAAEEATFGMKNKNKSKKIQKQIEVIKSNALIVNKKNRPPTTPVISKKQSKRDREELKAHSAKKYSVRHSPNANGGIKPDQTPEGQGRRAQRRKKAVEMFEEIVEETPIEVLIEEAKQNAPPGPMVTAETFAIWKAKKNKQKLRQQQSLEKRNQKLAKTGKNLDKLTGRQLMQHRADLFKDDDSASTERIKMEIAQEPDDYTLEEEDEEESEVKVSDDLFDDDIPDESDESDESDNEDSTISSPVKT